MEHLHFAVRCFRRLRSGQLEFAREDFMASSRLGQLLGDDMSLSGLHNFVSHDDGIFPLGLLIHEFTTSHLEDELKDDITFAQAPQKKQEVLRRTLQTWRRARRRTNNFVIVPDRDNDEVELDRKAISTQHWQEIFNGQAQHLRGHRILLAVYLPSQGRH